MRTGHWTDNGITIAIVIMNDKMNVSVSQVNNYLFVSTCMLYFPDCEYVIFFP